jgi:inositol transport system ATP-binding protein
MTWLLETRRIGKSFSGIRALEDVSFGIRPGEVHAVMGENGAGKSTLMRILAGVEKPDTGQIWFKGAPIHFRNAHEALRAGVVMIYQELLPLPNLSVAENIFLGQEPVSNRLGWVDRETMHRKAEDVLGQLGVRLAPQRLLRELPVAEMQAVEIAKALAHRAELIIMDEPTSALSEREATALFRIVWDLRARGVAVIYISHKLEEVFQLADRVTVLRDGRHVSTAPLVELSQDRLIALMVGRELEEVPPKRKSAQGPVILSVTALGKTGRFQNISFEVRRGEILGLAGLMGAGRTDIINAIYGLCPADAGQVSVSGRNVRLKHPRDALRAGIGLVSEDRRTFGLIPTMGVQGNLTLAALRRCCRAGFVNPGEQADLAATQIRNLAIRTRDADQPVGQLSGGNQQKVVFGRTMLTEPEVLLLDEPTRGVDVGAKAEIHTLIRGFAEAGKAVVLVSSELPELLGLSDRILVVRQGSVTAELDPRRSSPEEVLRFAMPK